MVRLSRSQKGVANNVAVVKDDGGVEGEPRVKSALRFVKMDTYYLISQFRTASASSQQSLPEPPFKDMANQVRSECVTDMNMVFQATVPSETQSMLCREIL